MLHSYLSLVPALLGADGAARGRRRRFRHPPPASEELGKWIWTGEPGPQGNSYIQARKLLDLRSKPNSAILRATADSKYKLFVNGQYVGKGPARSGPGYTCYDTYDITDLLGKGKNVIAFLAHHFGEMTYCGAPGRPGLNCGLDVELADETITFATDDTWRVRRASEWTGAGDLLGEGLGFQEVYDAGARVDGWNEAKFNEKGWENAVVVGTSSQPPWGGLVPREVPPLREEPMLPRVVVGTYNSPARTKEMPAGSVPEAMSSSVLSPLTSGSVKDDASLLSEHGATHVRTPRGDAGVVIVLDFGREVFGNVEIGIAGSGAGCIDLGYGEFLDDGRVKPDRNGLKYTDRILLNRGRLDWQSFEPRAFRYVQIEFRWCSKAVALDYVRVNQTTYPYEHTGSFECSDGLLNQIWENAAYTTELCTEDTYIDSPRSDRAQAWAAVRALSRSAFYAFDDTRLLALSLRLAAESQRSDGRMPGVFPAADDELVPDFALLWVFSVLDYYAFSDDVELLKNAYPRLRQLMFWFGKFTSENGLLADVPGRLFIDGADLDRRGEVTALNCLYYQALRVTAAIATILGYQRDAEACIEEANSVKLAINKLLYSPRRGLYAECLVGGKLVERYSRQANTFAAVFDIADHYQKSTICRQLLDGALPEIATPYFASYVLEALYAGELHTEALDMIRRRWGGMIEHGATTFWETFNHEGDLCFGWSVCPARDLIAEYVGIKPVLGLDRFSVAPHAADLAWAKGSVNTNAGPLAVEWNVMRNQMLITVEVPAGLKVDVYPPGPPESRIALNGKTQPSRLLTLSGGTHQIKVTIPPPPRPPKLDKSLEPEAVPHVEILGEAMSRGLRRLRIGGERIRGGRGRGDRAGEPVVEAEALPDDEMEEVASDEEPIVAEAHEAAPQEPRRRSRRGRRGSGDRVKPEAAAQPQAEETRQEPPVEAPAVAEVPEGAPQEPRRRSRRGRRGSGGRARAEADSQPQAEEAPQAQAVEASVAPEAPEAAAQEPRRRSRRGRRGSGGRARAEAESQPQAEAPVPEPPPQAGPAGEQAEPAPHRARRPSRRRRPRSHSEEAGEHSAESTAPAEPTPPTPPVESSSAGPAGDEAGQSEQPHRRPTRRGPRRRRGAPRPEAGETGEPGA